jgi:hypothetical protein
MAGLKRRAFIKGLLTFLASLPFFWRSKPKPPDPDFGPWQEISVDAVNQVGTTIGRVYDVPRPLEHRGICGDEPIINLCEERLRFDRVKVWK